LVVARRAEKLQELAASLADAPGQIELFTGDVTQADDRQAALDHALQCFGGLDLLVNNAGSGALGRFADATPERLQKVMDVNFFAPAEMIRIALPVLKTGNRPLVVNVSSILGHRGIPLYAEYCASKFALQGLSESLRAEFAPLGIDLLVASPGTTQTEFFDSAIDAAEPPWPKPRGLPSAVVARHIVTAIARGRHEVVISAPGKLLVWANRLFPRLLDRILARYG